MSDRWRVTSRVTFCYIGVMSRVTIKLDLVHEAHGPWLIYVSNLCLRSQTFFFLCLFAHFIFCTSRVKSAKCQCRCLLPACRILSIHITSLVVNTIISLSVNISPHNNDEPSSRCSGRGNRLQRLPTQQQLFFSLQLKQHISTSRQWQKCWNPCHGNLYSPHIHLAE